MLKKSYISLQIALAVVFTITGCKPDSNIHTQIPTSKETGDKTPPTFVSQSTISVKENQTGALTLKAIDSSPRILYYIRSGDASSFDVNSTSGVVTFKEMPDYELKPSFKFTATATDIFNNVATQNITITILDVGGELDYKYHKSFRYLEIVSTTTGRIWLDRNLGASQICTTITDKDCYGDYYQWGRDTDGHEKFTSKMTTTQASNVTNVGHSDFIDGISAYENDWARNADATGGIRSINWAKTDGSSICPIGYRVPTLIELKDETTAIANNIEAFDSFLKLPSAGFRHRHYGNLREQTTIASLWTNTVSNDNATNIEFDSISVSREHDYRTYGYSVRCIKDNNIDTLSPIFTSSPIAVVKENQTTAITLVALDNSDVTYSISKDDSDSFNLNENTGVVTFITAPKFETKQKYSFRAQARDASGNDATQDVEIIILNPADAATITHNNVLYSTIISPLTGKVWLDRNLGASQVCATIDDKNCYGDYYQWGRESDGHENSLSVTTPTQTTEISAGHGNFIKAGDNDWLIDDVDNDGKLRTANWKETDGSSICPKSYRVPTMSELNAETNRMNNNIDAFNSFLKLPSAGSRERDTGLVDFQGDVAILWSNDTYDTDSMDLNFHANTIYSDMDYRSYGFSIRCIHDYCSFYNKI